MASDTTALPTLRRNMRPRDTCISEQSDSARADISGHSQHMDDISTERAKRLARRRDIVQDGGLETILKRSAAEAEARKNVGVNGSSSDENSSREDAKNSEKDRPPHLKRRRDALAKAKVFDNSKANLNTSDGEEVGRQNNAENPERENVPPKRRRIAKQPTAEEVVARGFMVKEARYARVSANRDHLLKHPPKTKNIYVRGGTIQSACILPVNWWPYNWNEEKPEHSKVKAAKKRLVYNQYMGEYFKHMRLNENYPMAGVPLDTKYRPKKLDCATSPPRIDASMALGSDLWRDLARIPALSSSYVATFGRPDTKIFGEQEEAFHARPSIKIPIPDILKGALVDDWENVTKSNQLVPLPHPKPVTKILEDYVEYEKQHREEGSASLDILDETIAGLKEYFDKCLGRILLYRFERAQYAEIREKWADISSDLHGKTPCDTYGAEHLVRLISSLPELIAQTNMDQQSVNRLREELSKFCVWLARNAFDYFLSDYEVPNAEYAERAKN